MFGKGKFFFPNCRVISSLSEKATNYSIIEIFDRPLLAPVAYDRMKRITLGRAYCCVAARTTSCMYPSKERKARDFRQRNDDFLGSKPSKTSFVTDRFKFFLSKRFERFHDEKNRERLVEFIAHLFQLREWKIPAQNRR